MTEKEWLNGRNLHEMLKHLSRKVSERKFRLTECAFNRRFWHLLSDMRNQRAIEVAELFADGHASKSELNEVYAHAEAAFKGLQNAHFPDGVGCPRNYWGGVVSAAQQTSFSFYDMAGIFNWPPERWGNMSNLVWSSTAAHPIGVCATKGDKARRADGVQSCQP